MPKAKTPLEKEVQAECLKWLNSQPTIWAWRRTVGMFRSGPRIIRVNQKGQSDIEGIINVRRRDPQTMMFQSGDIGVHLEIETKRQGNEPTDDQSAWSLAVQAIGGIALWCNSLDMLKDKLRMELDHRGWR